MSKFKWHEWYKDGEFMILSKQGMDEDKFFDNVREVSQKMFGMPSESNLKKLNVPVGKYEKQ